MTTTTQPKIPCERCGESQDSTLHVPADKCEGCKAPHDHHTYRPDLAGLEARYTVAVGALTRIAEHETRADRHKRGMVDVSEVEDLQRIARAALGGAK